MVDSHLVVRTERASRYLQQLCKHFAHKVPARFDKQNGAVTFAPGPCRMTATDDRLAIYCRSDSAEGLQVIQHIIDDHLRRFAWREQLTPTWQPGLPPDATDAFDTDVPAMPEG